MSKLIIPALKELYGKPNEDRDNQENVVAKKIMQTND